MSFVRCWTLKLEREYASGLESSDPNVREIGDALLSRCAFEFDVGDELMLHVRVKQLAVMHEYGSAPFDGSISPPVLVQNAYNYVVRRNQDDCAQKSAYEGVVVTDYCVLDGVG